MMLERHSHNRFWLAIIVLAIAAVASLVAAAWVANELFRTRDSLLLVESELVAAEAQLASVETELAATQAGLAGTQTELAAREIELSTTEATLSNLQVNYSRLTTGYGYVLRDPSYGEMKKFLADDETSERKYREGAYTCVDFAADVKANAAKAGIRCAYVVIEYRGGAGHTIVAFDTTDEGLVFIEPQFDWESEPEVGKRYYRCVRPPPGHYMVKPVYDDTITRIIVVW